MLVQTVYLSIEFECEKNENKQKRGRDLYILKKLALKGTYLFKRTIKPVGQRKDIIDR